MEQTPYKVDIYSNNQEIPPPIWNPKVHYPVHKKADTETYPKPAVFSPHHSNTLILSPVLILFFNCRFRIRSNSFPFKFHDSFFFFYRFLVSLMRITHATHFILFHVITPPPHPPQKNICLMVKIMKFLATVRRIFLSHKSNHFPRHFSSIVLNLLSFHWVKSSTIHALNNGSSYRECSFEKRRRTRGMIKCTYIFLYNNISVL